MESKRFWVWTCEILESGYWVGIEGKSTIQSTSHNLTQIFSLVTASLKSPAFVPSPSPWPISVAVFVSPDAEQSLSQRE
ncbi:hypothetical protein QYF36_007912 [Acer negundo]|nr:hypothetical protein QYF36_007912 [Acer negundo]